jgi:hydrogenase maturation protein HypF
MAQSISPPKRSKRHAVAPARVHYRLTVKGIVQGVGFRPFVYHLAVARKLTGRVFNANHGVQIDVEGTPEAVAAFMRELKANPPRLARVVAVHQENLPLDGYADFTILESDASEEPEALVPPDIAHCPDCARETLDPQDRHYQYPFTNCTHCGPRFTIIEALPYDRPRTAMADFTMCGSCSREYHEPSDRRFHAQPVACPACGPWPELVDKHGNRIAGNWQQLCWEGLARGEILAVKSLGGFHLVCDALNQEAVMMLRHRKGRGTKPLAVMCRDLATVAKYCCLNKEEAELLESPQAPIVVLAQKPGAGLPQALAPGLKTLGVMLPYTPLHLLLFAGPFAVLVMTSGNYKALPLVKENATALTELKGLADFFLMHQRQIVNRCDDSLTRVVDGEVQFYRRSRGYVPQPLVVPAARGYCRRILGIGAEMKSTFCLLKGGQAFLSQHLGELDTREGVENWKSSLVNWERLLGFQPETVAYDLHPQYHSTRLAGQIPGVTRVGVQHHHAHLAACLADNGLHERVIGVILDGTGYGTDGCLWGFEILSGDYTAFTRRFYLAYVPLPGGERSIRYPWRTAVAYIFSFLGPKMKDRVFALFGEQGEELEVVWQLLARRVKAPLTSGCGRFFEAVAALLGVCTQNTYEGQAAVALGELVADPKEGLKERAYPFRIRGEQIHPGATFTGILADLTLGLEPEVIATRFHNTVIRMVTEAVIRTAAETGLKKVVLSGGTFQNPYLCINLKKMLRQAGFTVYEHRQVPTNDGGISLGQAMVAYWRWAARVSGHPG